MPAIYNMDGMDIIEIFVIKEYMNILACIEHNTCGLCQVIIIHV